MESVSLKLETGLAKQIEKDIREFHFSTKTEFIREAIREKVKTNEEARRKKEWDALLAARGALKGTGKFKTEKEWHDWRTGPGSREMLEYYEKKFGVTQK
ncbi:MAG: ribbon-helix-helix domain-containing protein [Candidatus Micrarchaeota archaeon]